MLGRPGELRAGLDERDRRVVVDRLGLHRADDADVVGDRRPCAASSSLSQAPLWPCWANLKIDGATGKLFWPEVIVVIRWPIRTESGSSIPRLSLESPACSRTGRSATGRRTGTGR